MSSAKKNNTFRFPFDINPMVFIVLSVIFFVLSIKQVSDLILPKVSTKSLAKKIELDIHSKINKFNRAFHDKTILEKAMQDSLSNAEHETLMDMPFDFQLYNGDKLVFWNSVNIDPVRDSLKERVPRYYKSKNGHYALYALKWGSEMQKKAILIIPIKQENLFQGEYMKNYFLVKKNDNDFGIIISADSVKGSVPVHWYKSGLMYLHTTDDSLTITDSNIYHLIFNALMFIFFGISIHTYFKVMVKKKTPIVIFLLLLGTAILFRGLTYVTGFPNDFSEYALFRPEHFANDFFNKSLGDAFINACLGFWILLFFVVNVQGKIFTIHSNVKKYAFGILVMIICTGLHLYFIDLIYSIVLDSTVNFDTTLISKLDLFSFIGLLTFLVIFGNLFLTSLIANNYLNSCFPHRWIKYLLFLVTILAYIYLLPNEHNIMYGGYYVWAVVVFIIFDLTSSKIRFDFNSVFLLVWIVLVSFFGSFLLSEQNIKKENISRKKFAEKIASEKDEQLEDTLSIFRKKIMKDAGLKKLFISDSVNNYTNISSHIYLNHFDTYLNKYKFYIRIFDSTGKNINPQDTVSLQDFLTVLPANTRLKNDSLIYYQKGREEYFYHTIASLKINGKSIGTIIYSLYESLSVFDENNTDFILYGGVKSENKEYKYSMAIYENGNIISRKGLYTFPTKLDIKKTFTKNKVIFSNKDGYSEMWYHFPNSNKTIAIVKKRNNFIMITTLFAYNFLIYFSTISLYILGNILARSNLNRKRFFNLLSLNLRLKIQLSILFVVLISFVVIGYLTSRYLNERIKENARTDISDIAQQIQNKLGEYFSAHTDDSTRLRHNSISISMIDNIEKLSKRFDVDLSLFSVNNGALIYSSQQELFQSGVFSSLIPHNTFYELKNLNRDHNINQESIGNFNFIASYSFLRNGAGTPVAILQIPYISSNYEITNETNSVIVTIVNISVFVFLISSLLALFISNSVSRPFKLIVKQFTKINLAKTNEPLKWNTSDEIGMLVKEYNRMLRKLENSTVLLAKNERELAWREMAKQVAHEIKNPLTPMKLSLQMLDRAIKNKNPNVNEMALRVTNTMIEQIDNLTIIATNFSNFAKLPDIKKEKIILNEVLYSVTGMYNDNSDFEYLFLIPNYPIHIFADKGQLIRVFTNIIQNAIQSIPPGQKGNISLLVSKIKNNYVRISISDNGEGISKEKGKKLFQPYFTTKTSGTGLGLAMCKDIVEQFEGKIEFESVVKEGTTFHIDLPLMEDEHHDSTI